jgi:23S rRNA (uracil1939-C5)-methyltransferase
MNPQSGSFCPLIGTCGGCAWGARELADQRQEKLSAVRTLDAAVEFVDMPSHGLRDRVDLVWEEGALGLYALNERKIVDLPACPMMSPALEKFYLDYRGRRPPIRKGSVRLRVSPQGERGVWLDFANTDVKTLFEEKEYLQWLSGIAFVEIGQRRKALVWKDGAPKLTDPVLRPWFETYGPRGEAIPLFGPVGGFSQTGFTANRALVGEVARAAAASEVSSWLELFSGNGNFALALAARGLEVEALELDPLAVEGLERSRADHPEWRLRASRADVYLKSKSLPPLGGRGLLVDPPRAGLRQVLAELEREPASALIYVSCFTDVFVEDARRLKELGYVLKSLSGVDQFPHSSHAEWIALFTTNGA